MIRIGLHSRRRSGNSARRPEAQTGAFLYAGHALEVGGRNWLLPTSVELKIPRDLRFEAVDVESLLEQTESLARVTLLFLNARRDNPFQKRLVTGSRDIPRGGLGQVSAGTGTLVAFATAPGTVAREGRGHNSPCTTVLLRRIEPPGLEASCLVWSAAMSARHRTARSCRGKTSASKENSTSSPRSRH
ncbi:caspase family protein [Methylobacterium symbioticum]|uniref:caspase family protein n=1 Tax=Methylobacterium symbioticum TaxID=2584084 RepID=UPI003F66BD07